MSKEYEWYTLAAPVGPGWLCDASTTGVLLEYSGPIPERTELIQEL